MDFKYYIFTIVIYIYIPYMILKYLLSGMILQAWLTSYNLASKVLPPVTTGDSCHIPRLARDIPWRIPSYLSWLSHIPADYLPKKISHRNTDIPYYSLIFSHEFSIKHHSMGSSWKLHEKKLDFPGMSLSPVRLVVGLSFAFGFAWAAVGEVDFVIQTIYIHIYIYT